MKQYMVTVNLPERMGEGFVSLIPAQRKITNRLMHSGAIAGYSLSLDRSKLWVVVAAGSVEEVMQVLTQFPIINHVSVEIDELMFHQIGVFNIPQVSLN